MDSFAKNMFSPGVRVAQDRLGVREHMAHTYRSRFRDGFDADAEPESASRLVTTGEGLVERVVTGCMMARDWTYPKHFRPRVTEERIEEIFAHRMRTLAEKNAALGAEFETLKEPRR